MDQQTALLSTGTGSTLLMVLIWLYKTAAGKKIRSRCCERDIEMGFSVEEMTPPRIPKTDLKKQGNDFILNPMNNGGTISQESNQA
jgi:hypothetical protein